MDLISALTGIAAAGTAAVITVTGTHPIDVVKTRLQVSGGANRNYRALGVSGTVRVVLKEEGLTAFWKGIGPAWMREASYTSLRLGLYDPVKQVMGVKADSHFLLKFLAGSIAGGIGSIAGNPFDVLKTKMMATEGTAAPGLVSTASGMYKTLGIGGFYRGLQANIMRAMVLNGTKMGVYDQVKGMIVKAEIVPKGIATDFCAAFTAGFFMSCTVTPFDVLRTKLMNQPNDAKIYSGFVDCIVKVVKADGPMGLYAGFFPIWARFAPTTCLQLVIFEQVKVLYGLTKK